MLNAIIRVILAVSILLAAHGLATAQTPSVRAAVEKGNQEFITFFGQGNGEKIGALYSANAEVFPPNSDVVRGRDAIAKFWQSVIDSGIKGATVTTVEVHAFGNTAYEVGRYALTGEGGKPLDSGKYVVIWKRESMS